MAGGPGEHRRVNLELEEVLLLTRRWQDEVRPLVGELPCQPVSGQGIRDVSGDPAEIERVLVVIEGIGVHRIAAVAVEVGLLWRRDDEGVQSGLGDQRAHRVQSRAAVWPHCAEEREADTEVVKEIGALTGKFGLLNLEVAPRDHAE